MFKEQNKILLTGGSGFLGKVIFKSLYSNWTVILLGTKYGDIINDLSVEIPDFNNVKRINSVVHVAGKAHFIPRTRKEKNVFWKVNLEGTKNLCFGLERSGNLPTNFIFISTVSVYGLHEGNDIDESYPLIKTSDYAESKIKAEQWLTEWSRKYDVRLLIFRLPLVAGPNPPGNLGAMIQGIKTGRYFRIGRGEARKSIVLANDVADIITKSFGKEGTYNLTDGYHPSFYELETLIASQLMKKLPASIPLSLAKTVARMGNLLPNKFPINSYRLSKIISTLTFNDEKARRELGWNPHRVLDKFKIF